MLRSVNTTLDLKQQILVKDSYFFEFEPKTARSLRVAHVKGRKGGVEAGGKMRWGWGSEGRLALGRPCVQRWGWAHLGRQGTPVRLDLLLPATRSPAVDIIVFLNLFKRRVQTKRLVTAH